MTCFPQSVRKQISRDLQVQRVSIYLDHKKRKTHKKMGLQGIQVKRSKHLYESNMVTGGILSTSSRVFPYYQGESTIYDKGIFLKHNPDSNNLLNLREL